MNISLEYFLIVAQEQGISRGAERAMVSQQDMSNHIRRLEKQYGRLFDRRPKFALTPAGQAVLDTYLQVRMLERNLTERLQNLWKRFSVQYPGVDLEITHGDTAVFEQLLEQGDLHLFLGINPTVHPSFLSSSVGREPVYLIAAEKLLTQYFPHSPVPDTLSPDQLQKLPLIFSPTVSTTQLQISNFFQQQKLDLHPKVTVGDFDLQLRLAIQGIGGCFCPNMHLSEVQQLLSSNAPVLRRLSVAGLELWNDVKIVRNKRMHRPHYLEVFEAILAQEAQTALLL